MKIVIDKSFERDTKRLPIQAQLHLKEVIQKLSSVTSLQEAGTSKMEGASNAYRIRFGNYRIGLYLEDDQLVLSRVLDRKDIYKYFPKR